MIRVNRALFLPFIAALTFQAHAGKAEAESPSAWEQVKSYTHEKKTEAVAHGRTLLSETEKKVAELETQTKHAKGEAKATQEKTLKELKTKQAQASEKFAAMKRSSGKAWDATKNGFADAYKDLQEAFENAREAMK